ncbi:MAG: sulfotransferase [Rhodanobacter sp.]
MPHTNTAISLILSDLDEGRPQQAERACHGLLHAQPEDENGLAALGVALQQRGRPALAVVVFEYLLDRHPGRVGHWGNLGNALREAGRHEDAEQAYLTALKLAPGDAMTQANLGLLYKERAEYAKARTYLVAAAKLLPDDYEVGIYAAMSCCECGDNLGAGILTSGWRRWLPLDTDLSIDLAWMFTQLGRTSEAEELLGGSLQLNGARPRTLARLVGLLERVNRLEEADRILSRLPDPQSLSDPVDRLEVISALGVMAMRGRDPLAARRLLERLLELTGDPAHRGNLYFTLAKACDKQGDTEAALDALCKAHAAQMVKASQLVPELLLPGVQPLSPALIRMTSTQAAGWTPPERCKGDPQSPIFVVGFPRSGTTMLEQMLDAHPTLASMDEQPFLQGVSEKVLGLGVEYPEAIGELDPAACAMLIRHYWDQVADVVTLAQGQRLVDKNPLNLLHLPLISRLFPDAPIILALRHPCDVILSCYMQNFRAPGFQTLCSSLERLAGGYVNGMNYWVYHEQLLKPRVLHLRYEDLLDQFDAEVERIGRFIEVEDAAPLRNFHQHARQKGFISTPSYAQVTQPPNKDAVGRWHRYEKAFQPLLPELKDIMEHWGYDG